jgi:hypothetical protein
MIIGTTNLVINEIGAVFNVRIEGDTDANLFFTDATNSRVGVGTISPAEKLDVVGNIKLTGNLIVANGQGIDFSATPGTGTSELFDDYEEGTWTPTITPSTGSFTTVTLGTCLYTKIGRLVYVTGRFTLTDSGTGASAINIAGLPFNMGLNPSDQPFMGNVLNTAETIFGQLSFSASMVSLQKITGLTAIGNGFIYTFNATYTV